MNLRMIGLAMHNYHDVHRRLPAAARENEEGQQLLSWRVHILPYIEQQRLYDQFHLDEPWDSEHNKALIEQMPAFYRAPGSQAGEGMTNYVTLRGEHTLFPGSDSVRFAEVQDGLSNTLMVVEASDDAAVLWTKPDDLELDPMNPMKQLVGLRSGGFLTVLGDGSAFLFSENVDQEELNAWTTRNGGEVPQYTIWDD